MKKLIRKTGYGIMSAAVLAASVLLNLCLWQPGAAAPKFAISGFYLGATPDDIGVIIKIDPQFDEKYYDIEAGGAHLYFIKTEKVLSLYRIVQEQSLKSTEVLSVLANLKGKYGTPDRQEVKTSSVRPKYQKRYVTTTKNKAVWAISETQEFIAEIEKNRVVYELVEHDPENIRLRLRQDGSGEWENPEDGWDPDY